MVVLVLGFEEHGRGGLGEVTPAIGGKDGAIDLVKERAQGHDVVGLIGGAVEAVVGRRHALAPRDHQRGARIVVALSGMFERGRVGVAGREREGLETIGRCVAEPILQRGREEARPDLVHARLKRGEGGKSGEGEDGEGVGECRAGCQSCEAKVRRCSAIDCQHVR